MAVVRVSTGTFSAERRDEVHRLLVAAENRLVPGIRQLRGCRHYWAGVDAETNSLVNASVWDDLEAAKQMDTFQPMLDLAADAIALGVTFERPVPNYEIDWAI